MGNRVVVFCPAYTHSGGPELLHQLCYGLRNSGINAIMYYYEYSAERGNPVPHCYESYGNPYITKYEDLESDSVVIPETKPAYLKMIQKARKFFWWLSVDNYYVATARSFGRKLGLTRKQAYFFKERIHLINYTQYLLKDNVIHLVQSEYARQNAISLGIQENHIYELSDYINPLFIDNAKKNMRKYKREDFILYNPRKGLRFTRKIIKKMHGVKWIPLQGFSREEMSDIMLKSKVYVDFGNHPGKDRIPREAAISGCCIITGKDGSAYYRKDVNIPEKYKFDTVDDNIPEIVTQIYNLINDYDEKIEDFSDYRHQIEQEEKNFSEQIKAITYLMR